MNEPTRPDLEFVQRWADLYNDDVERLIREIYAPDCQIHLMATGGVLHGSEAFIRFEQALLRRFPDRRVEVTRILASPETVAFECVASGFASAPMPVAVFLTRNGDGRVVEDHTYSADTTPRDSSSGSR